MKYVLKIGEKETARYVLFEKNSELYRFLLFFVNCNIDEKDPVRYRWFGYLYGYLLANMEFYPIVSQEEASKYPVFLQIPENDPKILFSQKSFLNQDHTKSEEEAYRNGYVEGKEYRKIK